MNYSAIKDIDIANGVGIRTSLWVSGCPHKCKGCFNEITWDSNYGEKYTTEVQDKILRLVSKPYVKGLSLLGGEPLYSENIDEVTELAKIVKKQFPNKDIWCYTGYLWESVKDLEIMKYIDILVDGRFIESRKDLSIKFRGSNNQRIIDVQSSLKSNTIILSDLMGVDKDEN